MKKLLFATLFTFVTASTFAADEVKIADDVKSISYGVLNQFAIQFNDASNVVWTLTTKFQKASFVLEGEKVTAFYSPAGEYLGATKFVAVEKIPAKAKAEIAKKFEGYSLSYAIQVISRPSNASGSDDTGSYYVDIVNGDQELYLKIHSFGAVELVKEVK